MSNTAALESTRPSTVFFIDDSATMREVMKIAFRRENIGVVACHDAATAFEQMEQTAPDVVITDVIMPDKDGFEVCQHIKKHPRFGKIPVVLLSGVVNRDVADKALGVKADELIRKPFQPQDLIARVKQLLTPKDAAPAVPPPPSPPQPRAVSNPAGVLSGIFGSGAATDRPSARQVPPPPAIVQQPARILPTAPAIPAGRVPSPESPKLRLEVLRLENLVKKLQSELAAEREYARALEAHVKTLQESE
jgi:CheY-like chemotaxis protein